MSVLKPLTVTLLYIGLCFYFADSEVPRKPVIGIISTPSDLREYYDPQDFSYIKGSYAEFIEAGNGIPIAIPWDLPERELVNILNSVNGILFTGGDASLWDYDESIGDIKFNSFTRRTSFILRYAMYLNDKGIHFPVYGICQGYEVITMGIANTPHIIDHFRHPGQLDVVSITPEGRDSKMFGGIPDYLIDFIDERRSMFYHHRFGFNTSLLDENEVLNDFFYITATGNDDNGKEFIAGMEARDYPIYIVQYHPERVLSEWNNKTFFDHPDEAAQAIIIKAQFFVSEARKNTQQFYNVETQERFLLRNHEGVYINRTWPNTYFYDKKSPISYQINPDWSDYSDVDRYDCEEHDCSFLLFQDL